jgi:hypothetical protein
MEWRMDIAGIKAQTYQLSYDKIVKNMLAQSDEMTIRFINGLFGDNIPDGARVEWLDKEIVDDQYKAIVADLYPRINGQMYTVEIESDDNGGMALRIFKYSVGGVLRHSLLASDSEVTIDFPKPCVVFLKSGPAAPERLTWHINFFDGQKVTVNVPVLRLAELSVREIAERHLFPVGQFFLRTFEPLTQPKLDGFREAARALTAELKSAVDTGAIPAHIGLKIQDNIRQTAENTISRSKLEGVDLAMASSVMETLTCIDYDEVFHQLEERGRNEGLTQGRSE